MAAIKQETKNLSRAHIFGKAKWRATTAQVQNNTIAKE